MAHYFFDTSALGKRYVTEIGSTWVRNLVTPNAGHTILVSELLRLEIFSIFARQRFQDRTISAADFRAARRSFIWDVRHEYEVLAIDAGVLAGAVWVVNKAYQTSVGTRTLRTLDAIHLSTAIRARSDLGLNLIFVSADIRLLAAAQAEGFVTDDPNQHP